jgi:hypothetical protein
MTGRHTGWIVVAMAAAFACAVDAADPPAAKAELQASKPLPKAFAPNAPAKLDLRVPDVSELYTQEQILLFLATTRGEDGLEVVVVPGERVPVTPAVWGGLGAPFWAVLNPLQSWRILAPVPPDRIHAAEVTPEARPQPRDPFRP